jgi:hypothetical protein
MTSSIGCAAAWEARKVPIILLHQHFVDSFGSLGSFKGSKPLACTAIY